MKIVIYGASGRAGSAIATEAVRRGHDVVAVSRRGTAVEGATSRSAEFGDTDKVLANLGGADVLVVSIPPDRTGGSREAIVEAHRALIDAEPSLPVFVVGGAGALEIDGVALMDRPDFADRLKPEAGAMRSVLDAYRQSSGVTWTMLAPAPSFVVGAPSDYVLGADAPVGDHVTFATFAVAALDELESPTHRGLRYTVADTAK
ncbi:NAD(P)-dependent oxidoreductase [Rhodococcus sp. NPDC057529]|uniref:NAD(P)-dependent oxidoreductase n=1 Tax=Rhodococcus sp. NPDC057529 TaxID=3346158 RepID=UPI0036735B05